MRTLRIALLALFASSCTLIASTDDLQGGSTIEAGSCLRNSDCENESHVCIFATCSEPCLTSRDCAGGQECLVTESGAACVNAENRSCTPTTTCPTGTVCDNGTCKTSCEGQGSLLCLEGEECRAGKCEPMSMSMVNMDAGADAASMQSSDGGPRTDAGSDDPCERFCDPHTTCTLTDNVPSCSPCPTGFTDDHKNGTKCSDIDECKSAQPPACHANAECINRTGSAYCQCDLGYNGNGFVCQTNVLCPIGNECGALATCTTIEGTAFCVCREGYEGNGVTCVDIDECERQLDDCDDMPDACHDEEGGYRCECPASGYTGNGEGPDGCADINECQLDTDTCDDNPNACKNSIGGYACMCPPTGYTGDGQGDEGCKDIDECMTNNGGCHADATCSNMPAGSRTCTCKCGYAGNGISTCTATSIIAGNGPGASGFTTLISQGGNNAFGYRVTVASAGRLLDLGFDSGNAGYQARLALYSDVAGAPGTLIVATPASSPTPPTASIGSNWMNLSSCVPLSGGSYWIFRLTNSTGQMPTNNALADVTTYYFSLPFGSAFPTTIPASASSVQVKPTKLYLTTD